MTRPANIPTDARVRHVLDQYLNDCQDNGKRPSVLMLAARLGLSNTTLRRNFPELATQISTLRSTSETRSGAETRPTPYEILVARNAKLRRANRSLTANLQLAAAQIQRLGRDNARLRQAVEVSNNITRIDRADRPRGR